MSLFAKLQKASSEEDVKDIYIKALGLKEYQKNLIDIQTKEIRFEAKDNPKNSTYAMFAQLLYYVQRSLVQIMKGKKFSKEAQAVLSAGRELWKAHFANTDVHSVRDELKLNRPDAGWYQARKALQERNESGDFGSVSFTAFETAYKSLTEKLQPMVY